MMPLRFTLLTALNLSSTNKKKRDLLKTCGLILFFFYASARRQRFGLSAYRWK